MALTGTLLIPPELTLATLRERMLEAGQPVPPGIADQMAVFRYAGAGAAFIFWGILLALFSGLVIS